MKMILSHNIALINGEVLEHPTMIFTNQDVVVETFETKEQLNYHIARMNTSTLPELPKEGQPVEKRLYSYNGKIAECIQPHTRMHFTPEQTPDLFNVIEKVVEGYPAWKQPTGAHDAYRIGDRVNYSSQHGNNWESKINANTTKPDGDWPYNRYWEPI